MTSLNGSGITTVTNLVSASHTMTGLTNDTHGWLDHRAQIWQVASISSAARHQQQPTTISQ